MAAIQKQSAQPAGGIRPIVFTAVAGLFFFIVILKFGSPVILDNLIQPPDNALAAVFESWQMKWGYYLLIPLVGAGLAVIRGKELAIKWTLVLPVIWLGWQFLSATQSVSPALTTMAVKHFSACCILYYLGCFALKGELWPLLAGFALALCWAMRIGFEQHFGGLEATRHLLYSMKDGTGLPADVMNDPAYLRRIASSRIFGPFSNPDALAEAIELLLPVTLVFLWKLTPKVRPVGRWIFVGILGGSGLVCLYWTGSKAGWLVALIIGIVVLGQSAIPTKWKRGLICGLIVLGVAAFAARVASSGNTKKEQASFVTRYAYWKAALRIMANHPLLGTGPGTFSVSYPQVKRPEDDFARLCHNDYLEQASDTGIVGGITYAAIVAASIMHLYRYRLRDAGKHAIFYALWLGILGLALHSAVDYPLYIPSLAWPMFFLLGFCVNLKD